ncbi:hypothetical protein HBI23_256230 [Parastagonospora nodorum]|nr:hypothetical protein HBI23_256230 [Parastagonospora nodorum]KAH5620713.1 hypothetical protein HBI51_251010 [Parastagonospora nodorum]KAH5983252.1 hypothetical protein HBI84_248600 [Parastagonospora nodorum]KAH6132841.1 hypothetical protein HBI68_254380 [Parastagonospora nodorum]KAH6380463.1 hypothetical protein HBI08_238650 [Parastagonospora nodorum]
MQVESAFEDKVRLPEEDLASIVGDLLARKEESERELVRSHGFDGMFVLHRPMSAFIILAPNETGVASFPQQLQKAAVSVAQAPDVR